MGNQASNNAKTTNAPLSPKDLIFDITSEEGSPVSKRERTKSLGFSCPKNLEGWLSRTVRKSEDSPPEKIKLWIVLTGNDLYYFYDRPVPNIDLGQCAGFFSISQDASLVSKYTGPFTTDDDFYFLLSHGNAHFLLSSPTNAVRKAWTIALNERIEKFSSINAVESGTYSFVQADTSLIEDRDVVLPTATKVCSSYDVTSGTFNVSKISKTALRNNVNDYWILFVGGKLFCHQKFENALHGNTGKVFDISAIEWTYTLQNLDLKISPQNIIQSYQEKVPGSIETFVTMLNEMRNASLDLEQSMSPQLFDKYVNNNSRSNLPTSPLNEAIKKFLGIHSFTTIFGNFFDHLKEIYRVDYQAGDIIIWENRPLDFVYILESGSAQLSRQSKSLGVVNSIVIFGDWSIFYNCYRYSTVRALTNCSIFIIPRHHFRTAIQTTVVMNRREKVEMLQAVSLFQSFTQEKKEKIADLMYLKNYENDNIIIKQGDPGDAFYLIRKGRTVVSKTTGGTYVELARLTNPQFFGELALLNNKPRAATVKACGHVECWCIDRNDFLGTIGEIEDAESESIGVTVLKKLDLFKGLSDSKLKQISRNLEKQQFHPMEDIIVQGDPGDTFYIIASGEVSVRVNHIEVIVLKSGNYFGEASLLFHDKRSATCTALQETTCLTLNSVRFDSLLGPVSDQLRSEAQRRLQASQDKMRGRSNSLINGLRNITRRSDSGIGNSNGTSSYPWKNLEYVSVLSQTCMASVYLSVDVTTDKYFVLKVYRDDGIKKYNIKDQVMDEKTIQMSLDSQYFVAMYFSAKLPNHVVMLQQFILGDTLHQILYEKSKLGSSLAGGVPTKKAAFYFLSVLAAVDYLHDSDIIHRDINPDNILVDNSGQIKLTDFGFSKKSQTEYLYTICGSPQYIAPEMLSLCGYDSSIDIWALGILLWELLFRSAPFAGFHENDTIMNILLKPINVESSSLDRESKDLLKGLLMKQPTLRLGLLRNGTQDIWNHPFVVNNGFSKEVFVQRRANPPFIPQKEINYSGNSKSFPFDMSQWSDF